MSETVDAASRSRQGGSRRAWHVSLGLMASSGFAGLGYQIVWVQQCAVWLGHESAAVLAVVSAFFGGLAVGAIALGPSIERSPCPVHWYAACEAVVAAWGLVLLVAMPVIGDHVLDLIGVDASPVRQWTIAFASTFALLLPATAAMGATLPSIERVLSATSRPGGRSIAAPYASNTFGAVVGVLASAFWLIPAIGLTRTAGLCILLNVVCAVGALMVLKDDPPIEHVVPAAARGGRRATVVRLAATGMFGIGYEVLVVRVLGQVTEDTVYTFAMLLAVYLVGTAIGAAAYQRWSTRRSGTGQAALVADRLLTALATSCLIGAASLFAAEHLKDAVTNLLGEGLMSALLSESAVAIAAFALPTCVMGALFSHLCTQASAAGIGFGRAIGVNVIGAASAPLVVGVLVSQAFGIEGALLCVSAGYLALTSRRAWATPLTWVPAVGAAGIAIWAPALAFIDVPEGGHVVSYREGILAAVSVVEDGDGVSRLRIDNRQQEGSSATGLVDGRQGVIPVLLHPNPHRVLFLGLGTGVTASSAAADPEIEVDAVELLPDVIAASEHFTASIGHDARRPHLVAADARRYVRAVTRRYDVIVADNYHPARSGSGALYTVEHFEAIRRRLASGGLFCQWLPLHQLDLATLRSIVRSFVAVFPDAEALLASNSLGTPVVGLFARPGAAGFDVAQVRTRLERSSMPRGTAAYGLDDEFALLGSFIAGPRSLAEFAGNAPANTDDRPVVAYGAPRLTYAPDSSPGDRLIALLNESSIEPQELLDRATISRDPLVATRLAAYWTARDRFIEAGLAVRPSPDVRVMLQRVREPLMSVLRISPDFRPAYDPLLRMATALARSDASAARALLRELVQVQPARPDAAQVLRDIDVASR